MVKVMTLAIPLHDIRALFIVNVLHVVAGVRGDALAVKPGGIGAADRVLGEGAKIGEGKGFGGYSGAVAEDSSACWVGEHCVAKAVDEVGCCCGFA